MATTAPLQRKIRVLCLHGFRTNAKVMAHQTRALREALGNRAEFHFLDAPWEAQGPSDAMIERAHAQDAPFYEWCRIRRADRDTLEEVNPTTELTSTTEEWRFEYIGLERTLGFLDEQLHAHGPFDVALGFSQGSVVLTHLAMLYLQRDVRWWNLCICVGGVPVRGVNVRSLFETPSGEPVLLPFPSVHIMGKKDPLFTESIKLAAMYEEQPGNAPLPKLVFEHDGGHRFPSERTNPGFYERLASVIEQHCSSDVASASSSASMSESASVSASAKM